MGITQTPWDLHKSGNKDAVRHREKLKKAFHDKMYELISQEDIITSDGQRRFKVPIKALDNYRFVFDPKKSKHVGQGDGESEVGDVIASERKKSGKGDKAGDQEGEEYYEAEIEIDELVEMMLE